MTTPARPALSTRLRAYARARFCAVDGASLAAFRILFGLLMCAGTVRFIASGWIERFYAEPVFLFKYWGFEWVQPWPVWGMYLHFGALAVLALLIAIGLFYRASAILFLIGFTYAELLDVTNYLNHYYLVTLLALLCAVLPLHRTWSVDARRRPELRRDTAPAWMLSLVRFQVGIVYVFAGMAKLGSDWLLHAQPLNLWLSARTDTPILGPWLDELWVAQVASWFGFLFDTTIVIWLRCRRTRPFAYALVLVFHALTGLFFNIGMFPYIMVIAATVMLSPSWPRRLLRLRSASGVALPSARSRWRPWGVALAVAYCLFQVAVPLRHLAYPGDVLWNEDGMRWAWKVMVREKHGSVTFFVQLPGRDREIQITPRRYLTARQEREMAGQPDLILQLAHHVADDLRARGYGDVRVRAEALVSLNGRPAVPMIDPTIDLARVDDGVAPRRWVLAPPRAAPIQLRPRH